MNLDEKFSPKIILCVAAHPDDLEFAIAGSVAKWVKQGAKVTYLVCTDGSKGSSDPKVQGAELIAMRRSEQQAAAKILGVSQVIFFDYEDGMLEVTMDLKRDITREIRRLKPDVVFCMDPTLLYDSRRWFINHPDHRAAGQATVDSVYPLARDHMSFPTLFEEGFEPHKVKTLLLANFEKSNFGVDISAEFDQKIEALQAHTSQVPDVEGTSSMLKEWAQKAGSECGSKLAEAFVRVDLPL